MPTGVASAVLQNPALRIGGLSLRLEPQLRSLLPAALEPFVVDTAVTDLRCTAVCQAIGQEVFNAPALFDSGGLWRVYGSAQAPILALQVDGQIYQTLQLKDDLSAACATLDLSLLDPEVSPFALRQPLLELWYAFWLLRGHGLLLHGCGVLSDDGQVDVFLGASGAGKSTFAGIVAGAKAGRVLSDDRLILRSDGTALRVYGTPWHGEARFARAESGTLRALHFLSHADQSRRLAIGPSEAAQRLFACSFLAGWPRAESLRFVLDQCARVVEQVPCYHMPFRPDFSALLAAQLAGKQPDAAAPQDAAEPRETPRP